MSYSYSSNQSLSTNLATIPHMLCTLSDYEDSESRQLLSSNILQILENNTWTCTDALFLITHISKTLQQYNVYRLANITNHMDYFLINWRSCLDDYIQKKSLLTLFSSLYEQSLQDAFCGFMDIVCLECARGSYARFEIYKLLDSY